MGSSHDPRGETILMHSPPYTQQKLPLKKSGEKPRAVDIKSERFACRRIVRLFGCRSANECFIDVDSQKPQTIVPCSSKYSQRIAHEADGKANRKAHERRCKTTNIVVKTKVHIC